MLNKQPNFNKKYLAWLSVLVKYWLNSCPVFCKRTHGICKEDTSGKVLNEAIREVNDVEEVTYRIDEMEGRRLQD